MYCPPLLVQKVFFRQIFKTIKCVRAEILLLNCPTKQCVMKMSMSKKCVESAVDHRYLRQLMRPEIRTTDSQ